LGVAAASVIPYAAVDGHYKGDYYVSVK